MGDKRSGSIISGHTLLSYLACFVQTLVILQVNSTTAGLGCNPYTDTGGTQSRHYHMPILQWEVIRKSTFVGHLVTRTQRKMQCKITPNKLKLFKACTEIKRSSIRNMRFPRISCNNLDSVFLVAFKRHSYLIMTVFLENFTTYVDFLPAWLLIWKTACSNLGLGQMSCLRLTQFCCIPPSECQNLQTGKNTFSSHNLPWLFHLPHCTSWESVSEFFSWHTSWFQRETNFMIPFVSE
jgi:hypothetical protein